ncbi:hypothetical protein PG993_010500 [Apiospora rasikravindrae]|uniref:Phospholipase C/D domain-containing protein n=1 Tax=Apiospora rasikravindrae TaxID=990691 RepID=A0ABR1SMF4_9PEZI
MKRYFQHQGRNAELHDRFSDAMCQYWLGRAWHYYEDFPNIGTRERNSLAYMTTELDIGFSRSAHKYTTKLSKYTSYKDMVDCQTPNIFAKSVEAAIHAFEHAGITDKQRREAHLYRSFAFFHYGQYLDCFPSSVARYATYRSYNMSVLDYIGRKWNRGWNDWDCWDMSEAPDDRGLDVCVDSFYVHAAEDLFYAQQIDPSQDLLASLDADDRAICRKIQQRPGPQAFPLAEHPVPLLGTWIGDPRLWRDLTKPERVLLKLFRQRCEELSDGDAVDDGELEAQYAGMGITWYHDDDDDDRDLCLVHNGKTIIW